MPREYVIKQPPVTAHWAIRRVFAECLRQRIGLTELAERSGVLLATLKSWRTRWNVAPSFDNMERVFPVLGLGLAVVEIGSNRAEPSPPAAPEIRYEPAPSKRCAWLSRKDAGALLGVSSKTLLDWELQGRGPKVHRLSYRNVRYSRAEIERIAACESV